MGCISSKVSPTERAVADEVLVEEASACSALTREREPRVQGSECWFEWNGNVVEQSRNKGMNCSDAFRPPGSLSVTKLFSLMPSMRHYCIVVLMCDSCCRQRDFTRPYLLRIGFAQFDA